MDIEPKDVTYGRLWFLDIYAQYAATHLTQTLSNCVLIASELANLIEQRYEVAKQKGLSTSTLQHVMIRRTKPNALLRLRLA